MISPEKGTNNRARIKEKRTRSDFKASVFGILLIWEMLKIYVFDCICTQTFLAKDDMIREREHRTGGIRFEILFYITYHLNDPSAMDSNEEWNQQEVNLLPAKLYFKGMTRIETKKNRQKRRKISGRAL